MVSPHLRTLLTQAQERSKILLLQLDKQEEEAALVEIMLQEEIDELTTELSEERKALRFSELALRGKERDLEEALGCYNEKGEELKLLTAQVTSISSLHPSLPLSLSLYPSLPLSLHSLLLSLHSSLPLSLSSSIYPSLSSSIHHSRFVTHS